MSDLSNEAKGMIGGFWNLLLTSELTFQRPHILTEQARKGLDDLVEMGFLTVEPFNKHGGLTWKPTEKMKTERPTVSLKWLQENSFKITTE